MSTPNPYRLIHVEALQKFIEIKGKVILVIGIGNGEEAEFLMEKIPTRIYGVDTFIPPTIYSHQDFVAIEADSASLPFSNSTFDVIFSHATFEHVENLNESFLEIERTLKPNGVCYVVASPLWFSEQGHHRADIFSNLPWFHVLQDENEMISEYLEYIEFKQPPNEHLEAIKWIANTSELNRQPVENYLRATRKLKRMKLVLQSIDAGTKPIPERVLKRALGKVSVKSLNSWTFVYVGRKKSGLKWWIRTTWLRLIGRD